ncbi:hypothetical protein RN001_003671 [Aquatica leii]|uniref:MADF domain-containing protein n=1 Tax=Aquatica leii TaxID=1421715 RepID=A0AAN7ST26_9COLE|nr:hypothetical protein RN001_003671 [Aquatica leii]
MPLQKYRKEWEKIAQFKDWLSENKTDNTKAVCKFCKCELLAKLHDLHRHTKTQKHTRAAEPYSNSRQTKLNYPTQNEVTSKQQAEARLVLFVAAHASIRNVDHLTNICNKSFADTSNEVTIEELLISLIEVRPSLWDSRLSLCDRSKTIRDKLWFEIYEHFGEQEEYSIEVLMKKWRNLRDTYVRIKSEFGNFRKRKLIDLDNVSQIHHTRTTDHDYTIKDTDSITIESETAEPLQVLPIFQSSQFYPRISISNSDTIVPIHHPPSPQLNIFTPKSRGKRIPRLLIDKNKLKSPKKDLKCGSSYSSITVSAEQPSTNIDNVDQPTTSHDHNAMTERSDDKGKSSNNKFNYYEDDSLDTEYIPYHDDEGDDEYMDYCFEISDDNEASRDVDKLSTIETSVIAGSSKISAIRNSPLCESTSSSKSMESKEVCDHICEEAKQRFAFTNHLIAAKLFYKEHFNTYQKD